MFASLKERWLFPAILVCIMTVGIVLRFVALGESELTFTEAFSWRVATFSLNDLLSSAARDTHPPGYFLVLKGWIALFGESVFALRSLSVTCGALCVPFMYLLAIEAVVYAHENAQPLPNEPQARVVAPVGVGIARWAALLAAALLALHSWQIEPARTARMYSLGALFAILTTWLLLKARRQRPARYGLWSLYGAAVAAFCYVHYFALFTVTAQVVWATCSTVQPSRGRRFGIDVRALEGLLLSLGIAALLFSPWLPVWLAQARRVQDGFWIEAMGASDAAALFVSWATGSDVASRSAALLLVVVAIVVLGLAWLAMRGGAATRLLVLSALLPWVLAWAVSTFGGRPLLLGRYMTFANVAWLACLGLAILRATGWLLRASIAAVCLFVAAEGAVSALAPLPVGTAAYGRAVAWIGANGRSRDVVVVGMPQELYLIAYCARRDGLRLEGIYCATGIATVRGQVSDVAALRASDAFRDIAEPPPEMQRIWSLNAALAPPKGWKVVSKQTIDGPRQGECQVSLLVRDKEQVPRPPRRGPANSEVRMTIAPHSRSRTPDHGRRIPWVIVAPALAAGIAVGVSTGTSRLRQAEPAVGLFVAPESLEFGEVWPQPDFHWTLPVENRTKNDLAIVKLIPNCGCAAVEINPSPLVVPAGETVPLRVTLDLLSIRPDEAASEFRDMGSAWPFNSKGRCPPPAGRFAAASITPTPSRRVPSNSPRRSCVGCRLRRVRCALRVTCD